MKARATKAAKPEAPGAFLTDGSYSSDGEYRHRGHLDSLVRSLVAQRRSGALSLSLACRAIRAANAVEAFRCVGQWEACEHWALARSSTSAEEAVKREGRGVTGHWCGQRYAAGPERDCDQAAHRVVRMPGPDLVAQVAASMEDDLPAPEYAEPVPKARTGESSGAPDEAWFARQAARGRR